MNKSTQKQQIFCKTCCKLINTFCVIKLQLTLQSLMTQKIGELLLTANSPILATEQLTLLNLFFDMICIFRWCDYQEILTPQI